MTDAIEREIRAMFDELRAIDAASAPAFGAIVSQGLPQTIPIAAAGRGRRVIWAAVAAGAIIAAAVFALRSGHDTQPAVASTDISQWTAPTDILLDLSRESIAPRDFNTSVLDSFKGN